MRFQAPVSVFLALLLGFSCYPLSHVAYADEMGFSGGRVGEDSTSNVEIELKAIGEDREAVAGETHQGQGLEGDFQEEEIVSKVSEGFRESQSIEDYQYGYGDSSSGELSSSDYLAGNGFTPSPDSNYGDDGSFTSSDDLASPRVAPAVLLGWAATALGAAASVTGILSSLNDLFGSPSGSSMTRTEALLSSILGWQYELSNDTGALGIRLINIYNLINQMYTNDFKGIYSLISHIGTNTEVSKTKLNNISSYLYAEKAEDGLGVANWVVATYYMLKKNLGEGYNASAGYGLINWTIAIHDRLKEVNSKLSTASSSLSTISSYLSGKTADAGTGVVNWQIATYNLLKRSLSAWSAGDDNALTNWVIALHDRLKEIKVLISGVSSINPDITVSFDDSSIISSLAQINESIHAINPGLGGGGDLFDKLLSAVDAISGFINPGEVVNGVSDVMGNLAEVPELAESLIGDLQFDSLDALSSNIGTVVQNKFPFSIPFVYSGFLLMFKVPAAPPFFEFDFWGAPLVLDFSDYESLAELTRFFSVAFFLVGLLSVTRRFIFFGGGSGAD